MLIIDAENNIKLTRGDTAILDIELTDETGEPYIMDPDDWLIFTVRRIAGVGQPVLSKKVNGNEITISTDDTKGLSFGIYMYDIYLYNERTQKLDTFIAERELDLSKEVHNFE